MVSRTYSRVELYHNSVDPEKDLINLYSSFIHLVDYKRNSKSQMSECIMNNNVFNTVFHSV